MMRILSSAGRRWMKFAEIMGNIQMTVLLTLIYWSLILVVAIPFKVITGRQASTHQANVHWVSREPVSDLLDSMREQG